MIVSPSGQETLPDWGKEEEVRWREKGGESGR